MKFKFLLVLATAFLMVAGTAIAGNGGPNAAGYWEGAGQAMYPDGTIAEITLVQAMLFQDGNFIHGGAAFTVVIGEDELPVQEGQMSGHISGNALTGVMGGCDQELGAPYCMGAGVFEGKLSGNRLTGTMVDLSDGSTSVITLYRMTPD